MAYNHKKLGKVIADCIERGGFVSIHYPQFNKNKGECTTPQQALYFMDQARDALRLEDKALIVKNYDEDSIKRISSYETSLNDLSIRVISSFVKPSTEGADGK